MTGKSKKNKDKDEKIDGKSTIFSFEATTYANNFALMYDEIIKGSDRSVVIITASRFDDLLYNYLKSFLKPVPSGRDELFDGDAPLSTFSSKIHMTYRLGLIDSETSGILHNIRKIRNEFAHNISGCDLSKGSQGDRVLELHRRLSAFPDYEKFRETQIKLYNWDKEMDGSKAFRIICLYLIEVLDVNSSYIKPISNTDIPTLSGE